MVEVSSGNEVRKVQLELLTRSNFCRFDVFVGNTNYWEKQKLGKEYFGSPAVGKKPWEKRLLKKKKRW